jgi:hypothetical protein
MDDLNERDLAIAGELYTAAIAQQVRSATYQKNATRLIMARYLKVDPFKYPAILGVSRQNSNADAEKHVNKMAGDMQSAWYGLSSWAQDFISGETAWRDMQSHINNIDRIRLMLKLPRAQTELIAFRDRIEYLHNYQGGLFSRHPRRFASIADDGEPEPYYAKMSAEDKIAFWQARWTEDVFVSFLWEFQSVPHYK